MWHALRGTEFDLGIDVDKIMEAEEVFKDCMKDYFVPPEAKAVEPIIPFSPMPGGALTANTQMMRDNQIMHRYPEVIKAMGEVVKRGGFGSSVTPVSQFYFQQAFNNVMIGPWKKMAEGYGKMVLGYFGKTPIEPDPEIVKIASEQMGLEPTKKSPLEINDEDPGKGIEAARKLLQAEGLEETEENIFIAAACKDKGITFLKGEATVGVRKKSPESAENGYTVTVDGQRYSVKIDNNQAVINGKAYNIDVKEGLDEKEEAEIPANKAEAKTSDATPLNAPLPGVVVKVVATVGQTVKDGDTILILEAMKMETEVKAPVSGKIQEILVKQGEQIQIGHVLALIN